jgi:hypothetical protein
MLHVSSCSLHCWITHHLGAGIEKAEPNTQVLTKEAFRMLHLNKCSQPLKTYSSFATHFIIILLSTQKHGIE